MRKHSSDEWQFPTHEGHVVEKKADLKDGKTYRFVMRCANRESGAKRCGTQLNDSLQMPVEKVREEWGGMTLVAPMNAPRCPTCSYSTFSDLNLAVEVVAIEVGP